MERLEKSPNIVDVHVGDRVRLRRKVLNMGQEALAECIGVSFQQIQKYERGKNRISASKLFEISKALKVPISHFFEGLPTFVGADGVGDPGESAALGFLQTSEGVELADVFPRIKSKKARSRILELVKSLADECSSLSP